MIIRAIKLALLAGAGMAAWKAMQQRQGAQSGPFAESALRDSVAMAAAARSAQLRGASAELRGLAQQLEHDHGELNGRLAEAAGTQVPDSPDASAQDALRKLDGAQGEDYDRAWLRHMASGHARAIRMFQREVDQDGSAADVASEALPRLREHARRIRELQASTGAAARSGSDDRQARDTSRPARADVAGDASGAMA